MKLIPHILLATAATGLVACNGESETDAAEDRIETAAEQSATVAGTEEAALGMSEWQLLDAELVDASGVELGDVESISRDASGAVDRLLVEVEDSDPDKYVYVPITGLSSIQRGDDMDISTTMTKAEFDALPAEDPTAIAPAMQ